MADFGREEPDDRGPQFLKKRPFAHSFDHCICQHDECFQGLDTGRFGSLTINNQFKPRRTTIAI